MMRGLLSADAALTSEAFLSMGDTILVNSAHQFAEGIQADASFQQHGAQLYNAGYGYGYVQGLLKYAAFGAGTPFGFTPRQNRVLLDYLLDGAQWCIRGDTMEYTSFGRGLARAGGGASALGFIGMLPNAISICGGYRQAELEAFQQRLSGTASSALTGNRNFWRSDFMVHHRPAFSISVKTSSTRTLQPETGNGEALKNLHLADGVTLIQRTGNEYDDIMPCGIGGDCPAPPSSREPIRSSRAPTGESMEPAPTPAASPTARTARRFSTTAVSASPPKSRGSSSAMSWSPSAPRSTPPPPRIRF
jgi:chondroitin AC lyase